MLSILAEAVGMAQLSFTLFAACIAAQVLSASTATALVVPLVMMPRVNSAFSGNTYRAPAVVVGVLANIPPRVGQCFTTP